jgi:hypothetical protein
MKGMTEIYLALVIMVFPMPPAGSRMTAVPVDRMRFDCLLLYHGGCKH